MLHVFYFSEETIGADYTVEKALKFLKERIAQSESNEHPVRGPYLSQLELIRQLKESDIDDHLCGTYLMESLCLLLPEIFFWKHLGGL
jgi:hypothetical protein